MEPERREDEPLPSLKERMNPEEWAALSYVLHYRDLHGVTAELHDETAARFRALREADDPGPLLLLWWGPRRPVRVRTVAASLVGQSFDGRDRVELKKQIARTNRYLRTTDALASTVYFERLVAGWSRTELAHRSGVTVRAVELIEAEAAVAPVIAWRVTQALGIRTAALPAAHTQTDVDLV